MDPMGDGYCQTSPFLIGIASMGQKNLQRVAEQPAKELNKNNAMCSFKNYDSTFLFLWCCYSIYICIYIGKMSELPAGLHDMDRYVHIIPLILCEW